MKAFQVQGYGGSDMLAQADVPVPEVGDGEALVKISRAGINFIDVYMRSGIFKNSTTYPNVPPFTPGMEAAGVVEAVGPPSSNLFKLLGEHFGWMRSAPGWGHLLPRSCP